MKIVVDWMERQANTSNRDGLATEAMQKATDVWPGVGVYPSDELYWITCVYHVYSLIFAVDHPYYSRNSPFCHQRGSV
jgi:hypothetical protein